MGWRSFKGLMRVIGWMLVIHGGAFFYIQSLEGGKIDWIHANLLRLTCYLMTSVAPVR